MKQQRKQPYQWILFDADNTLFDYDRAERFALQQALADEGIEFDEELLSLYHRFNKACWTAFEKGEMDQKTLRHQRFRDLFAAMGRPVDPVAFGKRYLAYLGSTGYLINGAAGLLDQLQEYYRLGLITNGLKEVQRPRLSRSGLASFFEVVVVSDEIGHFKPNTGFFEFAHRAMNCPEPATVLVVGDNLNADIRGSLDFGLHACWYNPFGTPNTLGVKSTFEIRNLEELGRILL